MSDDDEKPCDLRRFKDYLIKRHVNAALDYAKHHPEWLTCNCWWCEEVRKVMDLVGSSK